MRTKYVLYTQLFFSVCKIGANTFVYASMIILPWLKFLSREWTEKSFKKISFLDTKPEMTFTDFY